MPPIEHECPVVRCDLGEGGGRYKTPPLPSGEVLQLLTFHNHNHVHNRGACCGTWFGWCYSWLSVGQVKEGVKLGRRPTVRRSNCWRAEGRDCWDELNNLHGDQFQIPG